MTAGLLTHVALWAAIAAATAAAFAAAWWLGGAPERPARRHRAPRRPLPVVPALLAGAAAGLILAVALGAGAAVRLDTTTTPTAEEQR